MKMMLYTTDSENNAINKTLSNEIEYDIRVKKQTSVVNPVIILKSDTYITSNYAYIPKFNRYYFIRDIRVFPNKIYELSLQCDVLESFKNDILNSYATITEDETGNNYIDKDYVKEVRKNVEYVDFAKPFLSYENGDYILITEKA